MLEGLEPAAAAVAAGGGEEAAGGADAALRSELVRLVAPSLAELTRAQSELKDASRARFVLCDSGSGKGLGYLRLAQPLPADLSLPELVTRALRAAQASGSVRAKCVLPCPCPRA